MKVIDFKSELSSSCLLSLSLLSGQCSNKNGLIRTREHSKMDAIFSSESFSESKTLHESVREMVPTPLKSATVFSVLTLWVSICYEK